MAQDNEINKPLMNKPYRETKILFAATVFVFVIWLVVFLQGVNLGILSMIFWVGLIFSIVRLVQKK